MADESANEAHELEGTFANRATECCDLLPYLKRLVFEALSTVVSMDQTNLDSCSLKFNKKLENGDLIIPAFVRSYLGAGKVVKFAFFCNSRLEKGLTLLRNFPYKCYKKFSQWENACIDIWVIYLLKDLSRMNKVTITIIGRGSGGRGGEGCWVGR